MSKTLYYQMFNNDVTKYTNAEENNIIKLYFIDLCLFLTQLYYFYLILSFYHVYMYIE